MEPMFVIHNIATATTDDNTYDFGDDVNIYTVFLFRAIINWGCCLNWLERPYFSEYHSFLLKV